MNFYETLGVPATASAAEIKTAWRKLAQANHPDKHDGGNTERYQAIQRAYDVLKDADKRAHYDATGEVPEEGQSLRVQALAVISDVIAGAIEALDVEYDNIIDQTSRSIQKALDDATSKETKYEKGRAKVLEAIKRTKAKGENVDSLAMILAHLDASIAGPLAAIANDKAKFTLAIEILAEHEYQVEQRKVDPYKGDYNTSVFNEILSQMGRSGRGGW